MYLSEDASGPNGLFYRWTAPRGARIGRGLANSVTMPVRTRFADGTVTRGKKFEGVWSNGEGGHVVNSFAFGSSDQLSTGTSNGAPAYSEFTGPTFSPDGRVLFVNIQVPGITLAITGP